MTEKNGIRIKAIVLGCLTDIGGSITIGALYGVVFGISMAAQGILPSEEIATRLSHSPSVLVPGLLISFGCTLLGGFVAGRIAKCSELLHGGIVGAVGILLGLLLSSSFPLWHNIIAFVGTVPVGVTGGYLSKQRR